MQISSRFTIAIHLLTAVEVFKGKYKTTSEMLASSVHVNPVIIRRILQQLKSADLIEVARGSGGATLKKSASLISLFDIYCAVDCVESGDLFHFHETPNVQCPVGRNIHAALDDKLVHIQNAFEDEMKKTTLADILEKAKQLIANEDT